MNTEEEIIDELRKITRLLTLLVIKDKTQREQIVLLDSVGLPPRDIAELIGTTSNTVSVTLSTLRRAARKKRI